MCIYIHADNSTADGRRQLAVTLLSRDLGRARGGKRACRIGEHETPRAMLNPMPLFLVLPPRTRERFSIIGDDTLIN